VIETARRHEDRIGKVLAGRNGILGALHEDLIDTGRESPAAIAALKHTPGGAFGSCRYKAVKSLDGSRAVRAADRGLPGARTSATFFYNGGGDSADTCLKVSQLSATMGYPLQAIHVPKTIDNDLPYHDNCPGFGSVAKYVAVHPRGEHGRRLDWRRPRPGFVLEVMAGTPAGSPRGGAGRTKAHPLPLLILFPEIPLDQAKFLAAVKATVDAHGYCTGSSPKALHAPDGSFGRRQGLRDASATPSAGGVAR